MLSSLTSPSWKRALSPNRAVPSRKSFCQFPVGTFRSHERPSLLIVVDRKYLSMKPAIGWVVGNNQITPIEIMGREVIPAAAEIAPATCGS